MASIPGINFSIRLDKSGISPVLAFIDTGAYPGGVPTGLTGYVEVTPPTGTTTAYGSFGSPTIYWNGGALTQPDFALALAGDQNFQLGGYILKYYLRHSGYDDTTLTKTFQLTYTRPILSIVNNFDIFTPQLSVSDGSSYDRSGMSTISVTRAWEAVINSVSGTQQTITGNQADFDLAYLGDYYDARYAITLTVNPQYQLEGPDDWVTLVDALETTLNLQAQIPADIDSLNDSMDTLKNQADAEMSCGCGGTLKDRFTYATALYDDFRRKGCDSNLGGLTKTLLQLLKIFNNNVNPTYTNTNDVIPAYDFQCPGNSGSVAWADITGKPNTALIEWTVQASGGSFPTNGQSVLTDSRLASVPVSRIILVRNGLPQFAANQGDGDTYYTKNTVDNFLTVSTPFNTNEKIICIILPL